MGRNRTVLILCLALVHTACRYGVGGVLPKHVRTVSIPPVSISAAQAPTAFDVEDILTATLRDAFVQDNSLAVVPGRRGDSRLDLDLIAYELVDEVGEEQLELTARFVFRDTIRGTDLAPEQDLVLRRGLSAESLDLEGQEEAFRALAEDLAKEVLERTVQGW